MRRWISWVRPLPAARSRVVRESVERGSIPYSAVIHPRPCPRRKKGTRSSMLAAQATRVRPVSMRAEPSANSWNPTLIATGRSWSLALPSMRAKRAPPLSSWGNARIIAGRTGLAPSPRNA